MKCFPLGLYKSNPSDNCQYPRTHFVMSKSTSSVLFFSMFAYMTLCQPMTRAPLLPIYFCIYLKYYDVAYTFLDLYILTGHIYFMFRSSMSINLFLFDVNSRWMMARVRDKSLIIAKQILQRDNKEIKYFFSSLKVGNIEYTKICQKY